MARTRHRYPMKTRRDWGSNAGKGLSHTRNRGSAVKTTSTCTPREGYRSVPRPRTPARCRWEQSLTWPPGEATWQGLAHRMASVPGGSPVGVQRPGSRCTPAGPPSGLSKPPLPLAASVLLHCAWAPSKYECFP